MNKFNHPVIVYVVISLVSLGCAVALFLLGGSLAEITGNNNSLLGFTFKAGGAIAGFILIYAFSHRTILKFNEKLQGTADDYKMELQKIMYDGTYLKYTSNEFRKKSWKNLTNSLYVSYFPEISEVIGNIVFEKFIPEELDYYHKDVEVYYDISESEDKGHVIIKEYQKYTIVTNKNNTTIKSLDQVYGLNVPEDKSGLKVAKFTINDEDKLACVNTKPAGIQGMYKHFQAEFVFELNNHCNEYVIEKEIVTTHTKKLNVFWRRDIHRYTHSFQIGIRENIPFEVDLITFGLIANFKTVAEKVSKSLKKHQGLLVPGEGYIIFVK
jgi:hypothetical protein